MTAMLRQVPEEYRLAERMSDKALYYSDDISPGTVLLLDDIALSEELQEVLKEATSRFDEPIRMRTVDTDRKVRHCAIPERCVWWLANVRALYDDQVLNRMLTCWVDDSEEQDRVVFERQLAEEARPAREAVNGRFDLAVCRELWRAVRSAGPVYVEVPFATRIGMASVSNRRNTLVLVDLVRRHALLHLRQRPCERLGDGTLVVTATRADFDYAAGLFSALHAGGGSLGSKFDRNEDLVLTLAAQRGVERFTTQDVQAWTGWTYKKARRVLLGYSSARRPVPRAARPVAGADHDRPDGDRPRGRGPRRAPAAARLRLRQRRSTARRRRGGGSGSEDGPDESAGGCCHPAGMPAGTVDDCHCGVETENGGESGAFAGPCASSGGCGEPGDRPGGVHCAPGIAGTSTIEIRESGLKSGSDDAPPKANVPAGMPAGMPAACQRADCWQTPGPRAFALLESPAPVPCDACGRRPSHFRERRPAGEPRHLCRACHAAAVRREQRAGPPLPGAIDPGGMRRVRASVGRCDVCDLEPAAYAGGGVRLCAACYDRETRRRVREGVPAE